MLTTLLMIASYLLWCVGLRARPWYFFRLNARWFNPTRGIFSKLALDELFPPRWRLPQWMDDDEFIPPEFPVFMKPEWGQNSQDVTRVDSVAELANWRANRARDARRWLMQAAAHGEREYELFRIAAPLGELPILTVTEVINRNDSLGVNHKRNPHTEYHDITARFDAEAQNTLHNILDEVGQFAIARLCVRASNEHALIEGKIEIVELNLFTPMPIQLLDPKLSFKARFTFIQRAMRSLALLTRELPPSQRGEPAVFTRMMLYNRKTFS